MKMLDLINSEECAIVKVGTIGWLKTNKIEVRQCKCVKVYFEKHEKYDFAIPKYEWKVAGMGIFKGTKSRIDGLGIIYKTEESAASGSYNTSDAHKINELVCNCKINVRKYIMNKYGTSKSCVYPVGWEYRSEIFYLETFAIMRDNTIQKLATEFEIVCDENGYDIIVPMLEGPVNGIRRYPTLEDAKRHLPKLKTYTLDDEEEDEPKMPSKITLTIEVETSNVDKIKELATIIKDLSKK